MSVYTIHDAEGKLVFEHDEVQPVAEFIGTSVNSLRVALSNGGGTYVRGRKAADKLTITQDKTQPAKSGPKSSDRRYLCFYPDSEFPDQITWGSEHEILVEEIYDLADISYQKFARSTIDQRLSSADGLSLMIPVLKSFQFNRIDIKRVPAEAFDAVIESWTKAEVKTFNDARAEFIARLEKLKKFHARRK